MWKLEGSWLDRLDKQLSRPMFYAQLGPFEYVMSVPGACDCLARPGDLPCTDGIANQHQLEQPVEAVRSPEGRPSASRHRQRRVSLLPHNEAARAVGEGADACAEIGTQPTLVFAGMRLPE
jgi:hypothetical protein